MDSSLPFESFQDRYLADCHPLDSRRTEQRKAGDLLDKQWPYEGVAEARRLYEVVLEGCTHQLGADHTETLKATVQFTLFVCCCGGGFPWLHSSTRTGTFMTELNAMRIDSEQVPAI